VALQELRHHRRRDLERRHGTGRQELASREQVAVGRRRHGADEESRRRRHAVHDAM
jgi:hypothetical protein